MSADLGPSRPAAMSALEERLLAASVHNRLFKRGAPVVMLGRYRVIERLGHGGMGVVFSAYDDQLDRKIAIKLLHAGRGVSSEAQIRLRREAVALGRLSHPNVVSIYEIGEADDQLFVAMEFVDGVTLREWLADRPRSVAETTAMYVQAGRGLAAAHAVGLVHRDFKPENALVGRDGRVRVVDFGLARSVLAESERPEVGSPAVETDAGLTVTGALLGTPAYMAPEQIRHDAPVDARSDQFSFCVALYESVWGVRPFAGATLDAYVANVDAQAFVAPTVRRRVPRRIRRALARGLGPTGATRWPDMDPLLRALSSRSRLWVVGLVLLVVAMAAALSWLFVVRARAAEAAERESIAQARVDAIGDELAAMLDAGQVEAAERRIADLVAAPEIRGTEAAASVWLRWGEQLDAHQRPSEHAWAYAYARTRDVSVRDRALLGLARSFHRQRRGGGLAHTLALISTQSPAMLELPDVIEMRFESAARQRDFATALALAPRAGDDARAFAPVLERLARATPVDVPADPRQGAHRPTRRARPVHRLPHPIVLPDGERLTLVRDGDDREGGDLHLLGADGAALVTWSNPGVVMSAVGTDLDGDGSPEIVLGFGGRDDARGVQRLERGPDGRWSVPTPLELNEALSDITGLAAGDLDGDGAIELVMSAGPWRAYDVRVLRLDASGRLRTVARRKLGIPASVEILQTPAGPRIATIVAHEDPSPSTMPPGRAHGVDEGIHLLRLDADRLVVERSSSMAGQLDHPAPRSIAIGDIDGDGLDDVVVGAHRDPQPGDDDRRGDSVVLALARPDGSFAELQLGGLSLVGLEPQADELPFSLVVSADDSRWVLGTDRSDATSLAPTARETTTGIRHAARLAAGGASPEVLALAQVGLSELALAAALEGARSAEPPRRRRLHFVAAEIVREQGEHARARALLEDAADEPELRGEALWQLVLDRTYRGDHSAAIEQIDELTALGDLDDARRQDAMALRAKIDALQRGAEALALLCSRPPLRAGAGTGIAVQPGAALSDPLAGTLTVETASALPSAFAWPLRWDGDQLVVEAELRVAAMEWGSTFELALVDDRGETAARIGLGIVGGGGVNNLLLIHQTNARESATDGMGPIPSETQTRRLLLRVDGTQIGFRYLDADREVVQSVDRTRERPYRAGAYRLELRGDPHWGVPEARARIHIDALTIAGATLDASVVPSELERAAALLVDGEIRDAAALLEPAADRDPRAALWLAVARAELGEPEGGVALLRRALADDPTLEGEAVAWLRTRTSSVAPLLRRSLGLSRQLALVERAWSIPLGSVLGPDPGAARAVRGALAGIEESCDDAVRCPAMRYALGRAHVAAADPTRARRAFAQALGGDAAAGPAHVVSVSLAMTVLEAEAGDLDAALGHARRALAAAPAPELVRDMLRARPELDGVWSRPAWRALLAGDDGLP